MVQLTATTATKPSSQDGVITAMSEVEQLRPGHEKSNNTEPGKWDVIIPNPKSKKTPRLCLFVTSLIFLMVAAVVLVLVIKLSLSSREEACCKTAAVSKDVRKNSFTENEGHLDDDVSWEMKRASLELRQIMGDFKPKVLFPIYRKDLPSNYIAYYELKIEQTQRQSYAVISAGEETGDYSLVETGELPSPLDKLREEAHSNGHYCAKFFRLTTEGITICEDHRINRIVATTGQIYPASTHTTIWEELDDQVSQVLPRLKREWKKLAKESKTIKQWIVSGKAVGYGKLNNGQKGAVTEKGLHFGEFAEIPVQNVTEVRIKFVGLSRAQTKAKAVNISLRKWQTKLCKVLNNICDPHNPTAIRQDATMLKFAGTKYLKFGVNSDENYVRAELKNQEIRFQVELNMRGGKMIIMRYGIVLRERRLGRSVEHLKYEILDERLFPKNQYRGKCARTGTMSSAWAMIFSYYDNLAMFRPTFGYRSFAFHKDNLGHHFSTTKEKQLYITKVISSKVATKCHLENPQHWDKTKLERWFNEKQGSSSRIVFIAGPHKRSKATARAIHLLKKGIPVIISKEHDFTANPKFGVVTRMRQQQFSYRHCDEGDCTVWKEVALTEFFVRDGASSGKWQIACTYHVAAALSE